MRYYSILRPVSIGTYPKPKDNKVVEIKNFEDRLYCTHIGREAWGYIEYEKTLSLDDAKKYELIPGNCCGNCTYFNGEIGDGEKFCDERELHVHQEGYCYRHIRKSQ